MPCFHQHGVGDVSHHGDVDNAKARGISWLSNLFFGAKPEATVELLPKLSEAIFNNLRDEFQVHVPSQNLPEIYNSLWGEHR